MISRVSRSQDGNAAVEFAIVAPILLMLLFGIIGFAMIFATYSGIQQLAAESARAAVAGLDQSERDALTRSYITRNIGNYPLLSPDRLQIDARTIDTTFRVTLTYDNSQSIVYSLPDFVPLPGRTVVHTASIQRGGY